MSSLPIAHTAHALDGQTSVTGFRTLSRQARSLSIRFLEWIVALTERAERQLARSAVADARDGALYFEGQTRFACDAAGGGSRRIEAARLLDAPGSRR